MSPWFLVCCSLHLVNGQVNPGHLNQFNPGVIYDGGYFIAADYKNSYAKNTAFIGLKAGHSFGGFIGPATGYKSHVAGALYYENEHVLVSFLPPIGTPIKRKYTVLGLAWRF